MRREFKKKSKVLLIDDNYEHLVGIRELLNLEGMLKRVKDEIKNQNEEGKDGFTDCIEDDKIIVSNVKKATSSTRANKISSTDIEQSNDEIPEIQE